VIRTGTRAKKSAAGYDLTLVMNVAYSAVPGKTDTLTTVAHVFGSNKFGKLGLGRPGIGETPAGGDTTKELASQTIPTLVKVLETGVPYDIQSTTEEVLERVRQVVAGKDFSAALVGDTLMVTEEQHPDAGGPFPAKGTEFTESLVYAWGDNAKGQLGLAIGAGSEKPIKPDDTTRPLRVMKGGTVSKAEIVAGKELAVYVRETLLISKGNETFQTAQEDGTVWFSGENSRYEGADFTQVDKAVLTQTSLGTYYSLVVGNAGIYNENVLTTAVAPTGTGPWTWPPKTVTTVLRMPRSVTIYENQYLYIDPATLLEAFRSEFNLIKDEFERPLPADAVVTYTSSDPSIADYQLKNGKWYLVPTKQAYGRIIITVNNVHDNYRGDYEVIVLPVETVGTGLPVASVTVKSAEDATIALKANGTVWMWGRINLRAGGAVGTGSTWSGESPLYVVTYEYP
ncbi:MAG: hypothetical protein RSC08_02200, partial [Oscillospiraceae bacterium]